jgi:hypothetical protein
LLVAEAEKIKINPFYRPQYWHQQSVRSIIIQGKSALFTAEALTPFTVIRNLPWKRRKTIAGTWQQWPKHTLSLSCVQQ